MSHEDDIPDSLPAALVERLRTRERAVTALTPRVDRALEQAARAQFASRRRPAVVGGWRYAAAAAAALAFVALFVLRPFDGGEAERLVADDVDGSGRVDVLDVFALARSRAADPSSVSQARIDSLAARIVALAPPAERDAGREAGREEAVL